MPNTFSAGVSVNIDEENFGKQLTIYQIRQFFPHQNFPIYSTYVSTIILLVNDCVCDVSIIYCHLLVRMNKLIGSREQMMECQELSSHLDEFNSPLVFCHNDLMCKNIIYSEEKGIVDSRNYNLYQMCVVKQFGESRHTVQLLIFVGLNFCGLGSSDNFVGLYFHGVPTVVTQLYN